MKIIYKNLSYFVVAFLCCCGAMQLASCNADKCKTLVCAHNGVCNSGTCICPVGYEGTNCETETRQKFEGNWVVFEKGNASFANQYPISIVPDPNFLSQVLIYNFNDSFKTPIYATCEGYNINIPNQHLQGRIIVGKGYIYSPSSVTYNQNSAINMAYEVIDSASGIANDYGYDALDDGSKPSAWNK